MSRHALTVIELIVVMVCLGILLGIALPRDAADDRHSEASPAHAIVTIAGTLKLAHMDHRVTEAPPSHWIDSVADIPLMMPGGALPAGITIDRGKLRDRHGRTYSLIAETASSSALVLRD